MKRNFFKKLSFVLASAMVLTTLAPASGALAASGPKLNSDKKYLHLGRVAEKQNEYNFNISGKKSGWKYEWTSANEDVAKVNKKNGVTTATGVGATKVSVVITDKDGEEIDKLTAKVTVRDNIEKLTITNVPEGNVLEVGEENDFNRSYVTESGSSKKTSGITRWEVLNGDKAATAEEAAIADDGKFTALVAGKYTIVARSYQSKAKYNEWLADRTLDYVTATTSVDITVNVSMQEPKQYDLSTVKVGFTSPVTEDEVKEKLYVHYMIGDVAIREQKIKEVKMSDDGLTASVTIYDTFVPEVDYKITYANMDPTFFKAATTNPEDVVNIEITTTSATLYENTTVKVNLLNDKGVIINQPVDPSLLGDRVTFESSNDLTSLFGDVLVIFNKGDVTTVTATYHTYEYTNGVEKVYKDTKSIVGVEKSTIVATGITAWTITNGSAPKFDDVKQFIAAGDLGRRLFVQLKLSSDDKIDNYDPNHADLFKLTSSNSQVLFVDDIGYLVPVKQGSVRVTVEYDKRYVGSFEVVVSPERRAARLLVEDPYYDLSNNFADLANVKATLKDQYNDDFVATDYVASMRMKPLSPKAIDKYGSYDMPFMTSFNPDGLEPGSYQFLVYDAAYTTITGQVVFSVKEPIPNKAVSWKMTIVGLNDNDQVDVAVNNPADINKTFGVELMGYARNGVKVGPEDLTNYNVVVKDSKGVVVTGQTIEVSGQSFAVSGQSLADDGLSVNYPSTWELGKLVGKRDVGRYTVEAIAHSDNKLKARGVFVIVDNQKAPEFIIKKFRSDSDGGKTAFMDAFTVKLHGNEVIADDLEPVYDEAKSVPKKAFVKSVLVKEYIYDGSVKTDNYIIHELKIGYYITVPVDFDSYSK